MPPGEPFWERYSGKFGPACLFRRQSGGQIVGKVVSCKHMKLLHDWHVPAAVVSHTARGYPSTTDAR